MKRLSESWKQQKPNQETQPTKLPVQGVAAPRKRFLGRIPVGSTNSVPAAIVSTSAKRGIFSKGGQRNNRKIISSSNNHQEENIRKHETVLQPVCANASSVPSKVDCLPSNPSVSFGSSFGGDFDDDVILAADQIEENYFNDEDKLPKEHEKEQKKMKKEATKHSGKQDIENRCPEEKQYDQKHEVDNFHRSVNRLDRENFCDTQIVQIQVISNEFETSMEISFSTFDKPVCVSTPIETTKKLPAASKQSTNKANEKKGNLFEEVIPTTKITVAEDMKAKKPTSHTEKPDSVNVKDLAHNKQPDLTTSRSGKDSERTGSEAVCETRDDKERSALSAALQTPEEDQLALAAWGLPDAVLKRYHQKGIYSMFEWQAECLSTGSVLSGGNLVYSAPTSAGKTMVAELLMLKRVLETRCKAIMILPFVSVAREKMYSLQALFEGAGVRVEGYMGNQSPAGGFSATDIAVCTIEKANSLVNRLMEEDNLQQLGIVVIDELHMVGDPHRGYLLELLLTKVRYMAAKTKASTKGENKEEGCPTKGVQLVGMSATLPNLDLLARWLRADLYRTQYRPVPLHEMVKIGLEVYDSSMRKLRQVDTSMQFKGDDDHLLPLCLETMQQGHSVLVFCPTKNWCERLAVTIAKEFFRLIRTPQARDNTGFVKASDLVTISLNTASLRDVIEQLKRTPVGLDADLGKTVPFGVAYHHAGLTFDERDIIEGAFREGSVRVLVATSTLSSGVNLPARRVIIRTPTFHGTIIDTLTYKQMVGRAGRQGVDTLGESILVCKQAERNKAEKLMKSSLQPVQSCLLRSAEEGLTGSMKRAILEIVVSGAATSPEEVAEYAACTLLSTCLATEHAEEGEGHSSDTAIGACIQFLQDCEFITLQKKQEAEGKETDKFVATQLGAAVLASALSPDEGLAVFADLQKARRCFVLENELHIIYQVTPVYIQSMWPSLDWYQYLCLWEQLSVDKKRVAELVGVTEQFLTKAVRGRATCKTAEQARLMNIHKRFYTALVLHDLVSEVPLSVVARKYGCTKGMLQSLQQSAATFAGMVTVFCSRLGWVNLEMLLSQFQSRLTFGVQRELVDLVRVSLLNAHRARTLYNAGYHTVAALAQAGPADVETLLRNAVPFQSKKATEDETEWEAAERRKCHCIWMTGKKGLTEQEAAILIVQEARDLLREDVGLLGIEWQPPNKTGQSANIADSRPATTTKQNSAVVPQGVSPTSGVGSLQTPKAADKRPGGRNSTGRRSSSAKRYQRRSGLLRRKSVPDSSERECNKTDKKKSISPQILSPPPKYHNKGVIQEASVICNPEAAVKPTRHTIMKEPKPGPSGQETSLLGKDGKSDTQHENKNRKRRSMSPGPLKPKSPKETCLQNVEESESTKNTNEITCDREDDQNACMIPEADNSINMLNEAVIDSQGCSPMQEETRQENAVDGVMTVLVAADVHRADELRQKFHKTSEKKSDQKSKDKILCDERSPDLYSQKDQGRKLCSKGEVVARVHQVTDGSARNTEDTPALYSNAFDDSFQIDTQIVKLMGECSKGSDVKKDQSGSTDCKTAVGAAKKESGRLANVVLNLPKPQTDESPEIFSENPDYGLSNKCRNNIDVGASDGRKGIDSGESNAFPLPKETNEYLNGYFVPDHTDIIAQSASPVLPSTGHGKKCRGTHVVTEQTEQNELSPLQENSFELLPASDYERCGYDEENEYMPDNAPLPFSMFKAESVINNIKTVLPSLPAENPLPNATTMPKRKAECGIPVLKKTIEKSMPNKEKEIAVDEMDDSLTFSMIDNIVNEHMTPSIELNQAICDYGDPEKKTENEVTGKGRTKPVNVNKLSVIKSNAISNANKCNVPSPNLSSCVKFSPGTEAMLDTLSGDFDTRRRAPPRRKKEDIKPSKAEGEAKKEPKGIVNIFAAPHQADGGVSDVSSTSHDDDYVPPTPEDTKNNTSKVSTPKLNQSTPRGTVAKHTPGRCRQKRNEKDTPEQKKKNARITDRIAAADERDSGIEVLSDKHTSEIPANSSKSNPCAVGMDTLNSNSILEKARDVQTSSNNSSSMASTCNSFAIIDVAAHKELFRTFVSEWRSKKKFSISLACEKRPSQINVCEGIGSKFNKATVVPTRGVVTPDGIEVPDTDLVIVGVALCWENRDAYYMSLLNTDGDVDADDSMAPPPLDSSITLKQRIATLKSVLERTSKATVIAFDVKQQYKVLSEGLGVVLKGNPVDPKICCWLQDPGVKEKNLHRMVSNFTPLQADLLEELGGGVGLGSLGLSPSNPGPGRMRAATEAVLVLHLMAYFQQELEKDQLSTALKVEMSSLMLLARMELNGFGFSVEESESQKAVMQAQLFALEEKAYTIAGHPFSLSSPEDISQVLFIELRLPPSGDPKAPVAPVKTLGPARRPGARGRQKQQFSTSKDILEKLTKLHPLPAVILEWRRITNALTKVVFPFQREKCHNVRLDMERIHGVCSTYTATGRVTMLEPNLQNIPRDFNIQMPGIIGESPPTIRNCGAAAGKGCKAAGLQPRQQAHLLEGQTSTLTVSMRHAFVPFKGGTLLAADYSQLELRVIAHLSKDKKLIQVLNSGSDVFKTIAAQMDGISPEEVSTERRQQAKQVCYGMIYGIGSKALGEQLGLEENDAAAFMETFLAKYTGVRSYLREVVRSCKEKGYVETIAGRRRYLGAISDGNPHARAHAERQAVNTTVQGSAADLVKKAMINIDNTLQTLFPETMKGHKHKLDEGWRRRSKRLQTAAPSGAYLVLQLHDELIYEVNSDDIKQVAVIVKQEMEGAMQLSVALPVKVKVGQSWGSLQELHLDV